LDCELAQDILSAHLDGEVSPLDAARARRHARSCPDCAGFEQAARRLRTAQADARAAPDSAVSFRRAPRWLRFCLAGLGTINIGIGVPMLVGAALWGAGASRAHIVRDGTLACILGLVALAMVLRPGWSRPLMWVSVGAGALQVLGSAGDLASGWVSASFELLHLLGVATVAVALACEAATRPRVMR
jgi:predicted anti-sigma-YlaC factor YlaD